MDTWIAELLQKIDQGEAIDPWEVQRLLEHTEGRRQLRRYLAMRQVLEGWSENPPMVSSEPPALPVSLEQLRIYLEQGTLYNQELDESARRLLSVCLPQSPKDQTPPLE